MNNYLNRAIDWLCLFLFLILISFPIFQILGRYISFFSIPASQEIVQHMTLWIGFIGAVIAARSNKLSQSRAKWLKSRVDDLFYM